MTEHSKYTSSPSLMSFGFNVLPSESDTTGGSETNALRKKLEVLHLPPGYNGIKANVQTGPVTRSWSIGDKNHPKIDFKMLQPLTLIPKAIRVLIHFKIRSKLCLWNRQMVCVAIQTLS